MIKATYENYVPYLNWKAVPEYNSDFSFNFMAAVTIYSVLKAEILLCRPGLYSIVTAMVVPIVRYGCESWTIKKAECQRIDAFELWCQRRLLRVPWTARRSN